MSTQTFKELLGITGLSLKQFSDQYNIPYRTCQNWVADVSTPPPYVLELLNYRIETEKKMEDNKIKKFEIVKNTIEIKGTNRDLITAGCTQDQSDANPEIINSSATKKDALEALKSFRTDINELSGGSLYVITEFYVEENIYDEDGEWVSGGDVSAYTVPIIKVISKPSYKTVGTFNNMKDAVICLGELDEGFLSFN